jgi:hypothetical protein
LNTFIQNFVKKALNLAYRHAPRVHRNDLVIEAGKAPFVLADELRLERAFSVTRHLDAQRCIAGQYGFAALAITMIAGFARLG